MIGNIATASGESLRQIWQVWAVGNLEIAGSS